MDKCPMVKKKKRRERRKFTREVKAEAVRLVEVGGTSIPQVAMESDLTESALRNWVEQARSEKQGGLTAEERVELVRLPRQAKAFGYEPRGLPEAVDGVSWESDGLLRERKLARYEFIQAEQANFPMTLMCRVLRVSM
jgi:transposase